MRTYFVTGSELGALAAISAFTGIAGYLSATQELSESADVKLRIQQWKSQYKAGLVANGSLAIAGLVLGGVAYRHTRQPAWLASSVLIGANWPFTMIFLMPTNKKLMATEAEEADAETAGLLSKWNKLHAVRTALGTAALGAAIFAIAKAKSW